MQKWEYCEVSSSGSHFSACFYETTGVREVELQQEEARGDHRAWDAVARYIAELGNEGWELVSTDRTMYIFKRPKA
jgi:hypothetical protein